MAYKHGVYVYEVPTQIVPPVRVSAGLCFVVGTAPINQTDMTNVDKVKLCYSYAEAVEAFGVSNDFDKFTLSEFIYSHFALFAVAPVVLVNVLNETEHKTTVTAEALTLSGDKGTLSKEGIITTSVVVKNSAGTTTYVKDTDYTIAFDDNGFLVVTRITDGAIAANAALKVDYDYLDASKVTAADIIGGIDVATGNKKGLELINDVFPRFGLVPGLVLSPKWSTDASVAAIMTAKASNINQHFKALALTDVPTDTVTRYTDVSSWKNTNNYTSPLQVVCWPKVKLGDKQFHLSTQLAGVICKTDAANEDIPYVSPSNKNLQCNGAVLKDGTEVVLGPDNAAYLNGQGIVTALNFIGGWKVWGNRTGCYPANTSPKDAFIPIKRMFNWTANTVVLTYWQKVDDPLNTRLVQSVRDSENIRLNGLAARQFILGGRLEFREDENPLTDLMDGIARFHLYITPPSPARELDFIVEYDVNYLKTLFA